jgi:hypothetical protein
MRDLSLGLLPNRHPPRAVAASSPKTTMDNNSDNDKNNQTHTHAEGDRNSELWHMTGPEEARLSPRTS